MMGQWADRTAAPLIRGWVGQMTQRLPRQFPEWLSEIDASHQNLDTTATEYHSAGVRAINAAALVFGHAVTDTVVDELLEISAQALPSQWRIEKEEFLVTLGDLGKSMVEEYADRARKRLVQKQRARSLPEKLQHLFTVSRCGPDAFGIKLDTAMLLEIDRARHRIVHGGEFAEPLERLNDMLGVALAAANAALFTVAYSCGYEYVEGQLGAVFHAIEPREMK